MEFQSNITTHFDSVESTIRAAIGSALLEDDTQVIDRPGWYQVITPSVKDVSLNEVILSHISKSEVDQAVEDAFASYKQHDLPFKWCTRPMSAPEIESKISPSASDSWLFRGMVIETDQKVPLAEGISVERVTSANFDEFLNVFLCGWGMERFRENARKKFARITPDDTIYPYYLARKQNVPIGCAGSILRSDCGYLVGAVVLKEFRGSGAYRALVQARLDDLKQRQFQFAVTQARGATSAPILEQLGFTTAFRAKIYKFGG